MPAAEPRRAYELATAAPRFPREWWPSAQADGIAHEALYATLDVNSDTARSPGSNNWVIAGSRTSAQAARSWPTTRNPGAWRAQPALCQPPERAGDVG
ncbi:hypothetical protein ACU4GD_13605 [Cupriavidus basilensis]